MSNLYVDVLKLLNEKNNGLSIKQISRDLNSNEEEIKKILLQLEEQYKVTKTKNDRYKSVETKNLKVGRLNVNPKGYAFVYIDGMETDVFIPKDKLRGCFHGDLVLIRVNKNDDNRYDGIIEKRLSAFENNLVGEVSIEKDGYYIIPDDSRYNIKVRIKNINCGLFAQHKVVFKLAGDAKDKVYDGVVLEDLGHKFEPFVDAISIARVYGANDKFPQDVIDEVKLIPTEVRTEDLIDRTDLRNEIIFTIDGESTKDIDDAVSLKILDNGIYELSTHIADVSYYVKEGSAIDKEAMKRGTSHYFAGGSVPMLPRELSNGICSLNPNVDRLAFTFVTRYDKNGNCIYADCYLSVINSKKKMTYEDVNKIFEEGYIPEGYEPFADKLKEMQEFAHVLRKKRHEKGCIDFDIAEMEMIFDSYGNPTSVGKRYRGEAEKLIEDLMLATNMGMASYAKNCSIPIAYRIHEDPNQEKLEEYINLLASIGFNAKKRMQKDDEIHSKTMQLIMNDMKLREDFIILAKRGVRTMSKARYSPINIGHFGLAADDYAQFTSPIRRGPDLINHRMLKNQIIEYKYDDEYLEIAMNYLFEICDKMSTLEKNAQDLEREVDKMEASKYMENHIGEEYDALVSDVSSKGMYVMLPNLIEGKISLDSIDERLIFEEGSYTLKSVNSDLMYRIGNKVEVVVLDASRELHTIDFGIKGHIYKKKRNCHGDTKQES